MAVIDGSSGRLKLTETRVAILEDALERGLTYTLAAKAATISTVTLWTWLQRGKRVFEEFEGELPPEEMVLERQFFDLYVRLQQAESRAALRHLDIITNAAIGGNVVASMWYLEHRHPDQYGRQVLDQVNYEGERESGPEPIRLVEVILPEDTKPTSSEST